MTLHITDTVDVATFEQDLAWFETFDALDLVDLVKDEVDAEQEKWEEADRAVRDLLRAIDQA